MKIMNSKLLKEFRRAGFCEWCNCYCLVREPHHLRTKGFGGGSTLDVRINLISLGGSKKLPDGRRRFFCRCHTSLQGDAHRAQEVLSIVALREKVRPEEITEVMDWLRRLIRPTETQLMRAMEELTPAGRVIALKELNEAGILT